MYDPIKLRTLILSRYPDRSRGSHKDHPRIALARLASESGIKHWRLSRILAGEQPPTVDDAVTLARLVGTTVEGLCGEGE